MHALFVFQGCQWQGRVMKRRTKPTEKVFNLKTIMLYNEAYFTNNSIHTFDQFSRYCFRSEMGDT